MDYYAPTTLKQALEFLHEKEALIVAGATDFFPSGGRKSETDCILDITDLDDLTQIEMSETEIRIGAGVTWTQLASADLPESMAALKQAALQIGGQQVQNSGTVVGNICNASPAADGVPPLQIFDAEVELTSFNGVRVLPLSEFITDRRETACKKTELVSSIVLQKPPDDGTSVFEKLGSRKYLVISIAMVAAYIRLGENRLIKDARVSIGACSPVAMRMPQLETHLIGKEPGQTIGLEHFSKLKPIADARGTAEYRMSCVRELCQRAIVRAANNNG